MKMTKAISCLCALILTGTSLQPVWTEEQIQEEPGETETIPETTVLKSVLVIIDSSEDGLQPAQKTFYLNLITALCSSQQVQISLSMDGTLLSGWSQDGLYLCSLIENPQSASVDPEQTTELPDSYDAVVAQAEDLEQMELLNAQAVPVRFLSEEAEETETDLDLSEDGTSDEPLDTSLLVADEESAREAGLQAAAMLLEQPEEETPEQEEVQIPEEQEETRLQRYTILVLDASGSLNTDVFYTQKQAAWQMCNTLLSDEDSDNYIALVGFDTGVSMVCGYTQDLNVLYENIFSLKAGNLSNISGGLQQALDLLQQVQTGADTERNVVLCSDGIPRSGLQSDSGPYDASQDESYLYANGVWILDQEIRRNSTVYTVGSYACLDAGKRDFARTFLYDLASDGQYYEASTTYFLNLAFEQITQHILTDQTGSLAGIQEETHPMTMHLQADTQTLSVDQKTLIHVSFQPASCDDVTYTSLNPQILKVSANGTVTALRPGTGIIQAEAENGLVQTLEFEVYAKYDLRRIFGWI